MRKILVLLGVILSVAPSLAHSQSTDPKNVVATADLMVRLCVGGGTSFKISGGASGDANFVFRALKADGAVSGTFNVEKSNAEGLVQGINNSLSKVAADEADKVRECLKPVRDRLMEILLPAPRSDLPSPAVVNCNNLGQNSGTINNSCGNVFVTSSTPPSTFRIISQAPPKPGEDGTYTITAVMEILSPYPIPKFIFMTKTPDVLKIEARSIGGITSAAEGFDKGYHYSAVDNANGRYYVTITTKTLEKVEIEHQIQ